MKEYIKPEVQVIELEKEDIIVTSVGTRHNSGGTYISC